ncbi:MAG: small-conductance mechanosensitive channel [Natronomonas sp.]|jgi:small-conductance mechanosensitive channel
MFGLWVALQAGTPTPTEAPEPLARPPWLPDYVPMFGYRLVLAVAIVVGSYYLSRLLRQVLGRRVARRFKRPSVTRTILRGMQTVIVLAAVMVALSFFGLGFGNVALSVGVFSAVVGIVLAPIIGNILSGVFVLSEQPYEIGDMIEIKDTETRGFVEDITLLYTKVFTLDNTFMVMPNGAMRDRDIVNYSAEDTRIRLTLDVGVTYESDIATARKQMESAARHAEGVLKGGPDIRIGSARYPASPTCYVSQFGDSEVLLRLRYWAHEPYKQTTVRSRVMTNVWKRFDEHDIEIPYPHSHLVFDDTSGEMQVAMREAAEGPATQQSGATRREDAEIGDDEQEWEPPTETDAETEEDADATDSQ